MRLREEREGIGRASGSEGERRWVWKFDNMVSMAVKRFSRDFEAGAGRSFGSISAESVILVG